MSERTEWCLMGKVIGTATGWDQSDDFAIVIYQFIPNDLGKQFIPDFVGPDELDVNWLTGVVSIFLNEGRNQIILRTDWSIFNQLEQKEGWQGSKEPIDV